MSERPNFHPLHLPTEFYLALVDVQSELRIGKSAAILLMLCEGLWKYGFLEDSIYELYKRKYSKPLMEIVRTSREQRIKLEKPKIRCGFAAGSMMKCRRIALKWVKHGEKQIPSCPEHLQEFLDAGYEIVKEA